MVPNKIIITNLQNNEVIPYEFLLINGKVQRFCKDHSYPFDKLEVFHNDKQIHNYRSSGKEFNVLLSLKTKGNCIIIRYCCASTEINVIYTKNNVIDTVIPMFIVPKHHNGEFQAPQTSDNSSESACKRLLTVVKLIQCILGELLSKQGFKRKSFQIFKDECIIYSSQLECNSIINMNQQKVWESIGKEIINSTIYDEKKKYFGLLSCTKYQMNHHHGNTYEDMIKATEAYIALGGGDLALLGSACLYTWPESIDEIFNKFEDKTVVSKEFMNDSNSRNTLGGCFSTTLGTALHEICHTFDLGHAEEGIMGNKYGLIDNLFMLNDLNACYFPKSCLAILNYHRYFNDYLIDNKYYTLSFDHILKLVKSTNGIRVIEIRENNTEMVLANWIFTGRVLKHHFQLPYEYNCDILFVIDNLGKTLKIKQK